MRTNTWNRITAQPRSREPRSRRAIRETIGTFLRFWNAALQRARQRRDLARLSDYSLRDIGVTRGQVRHEIGMPFWRE